MPKFEKITTDVIVANESFAKYLWGGSIAAAKKGGTFVGNYEIAPDEFRKFGIVLSKGGMIIPDAEPETLRKVLDEGRGILAERRNDTVKAVQEERESAKQSYLGKVTRLLGQYGIPGLGIVECASESGNPSWGAVISEVLSDTPNSDVETNTLLAFGNAAAFLLRKERIRGKLESRLWVAPLEEVEKFLQTEAEVFPLRQQFMARLEEVARRDGTALRDHSCPNGHYGLIFETLGGEINGDISYFPMSPGLKSAHTIRYEKNWPGKRERFYRFNKEDISELERLVFGAEKIRQDRLDHLWQLFIETQGVLTSTAEDRYDDDGKCKEIVYFVKGERLSPDEYKWLQSRLNEIPTAPEGFVRVSCGTNDLLPILEMPGQNDVLVIVGKTGSRRGEWSYGEWFRGHPSKCQIPFGDKGTMGKIKSVTLNGKQQENKRVDLVQWTDPKELANRALWESGMSSPTVAHVEALAKVYEKKLLLQLTKTVTTPSDPEPPQSIEETSEASTPLVGQNTEGFGLGKEVWGVLDGLKL